MKNISNLGKFDLIFVLREAIQFLDQKEIENSFNYFVNSINPGGYLILDCVRLELKNEKDDFKLPFYIRKQNEIFVDFYKKKDDVELRRSHISKYFKGKLYTKFFYDYNKHSSLKHFELNIELNDISFEFIEKLAKKNNIDLYNVYGDYDFNCYSKNSPRKIFILRKKDERN